MNQVVNLDLAGLGIVIYSPWAVEHIREGEDYLENHFTAADDVGAHVCACSIAAFCTGSSGNYALRVSTDPTEVAVLEDAEWRIAMGLEVRDRTVCIRDLYDLMQWTSSCPPEQELTVDNGFYHLTVCTSTPPSGILGDHQTIFLSLQQVSRRPELAWRGVPQLC